MSVWWLLYHDLRDTTLVSMMFFNLLNKLRVRRRKKKKKTFHGIFHIFEIEIISKRIRNYLEFMLFVVLHAFYGTKINFERGTPKIVIL